MDSPPPRQRTAGRPGCFVIILVLGIFAFTSWQTGLLWTLLARAGLQELLTTVESRVTGEPRQQAGEPRQQAQPARTAPRKKPKKTTRRRKRPRKRPARKESRKQQQAPRPVGPTPALNPPPPVAAPQGVPQQFEVPETDLDRALEDDDL